MDHDFIPCPTCRRKVSARAAHFPFCSDRCRLLDLGAWLAEDYRLSRPAWSLSDEETFEEGILEVEGSQDAPDAEEGR